MPKRVSLTLLICIIGAVVAVAALALPPRTVATTEPSTPAAPVEAGAVVQVDIANFGFTTVGALAGGQEVIVTNLDSAPHTLTALDGSFDTGLLAAGEQARIVLPTAAGEYPFRCEVHPSMTGTFTVSA